MIRCILFFLISTVFYVLVNRVLAQSVQTNKQSIIVSAIKGTASKPDTIALRSMGENAKVDIRITGEHAAFFKVAVKPKAVSSSKAENLVIIFHPDEKFIGIAEALLEIKKYKLAIPLTGLSTKALEGENEPALATIVKALGYKINLGWETLANNLMPTLQGNEVAAALFKKANPENAVQMMPVARYSPDFPVNFGLYTNAKSGPVHHQNGILSEAEKFPEHQTLFPSFSGGITAYDPGDKPFGFYAISPTHTAYSEDIWNMLFHPSYAAHAMRIYHVRDMRDRLLPDTYLVCMEEAANGDYNDYVFLVRNVQPVFVDQGFTHLLNGQNLDGWYTWLKGKGKNNDPDKVFTVEADGALHVTGKEVGYIMTERSFDNFHLKLQFKWGDARWPPRENSKRDSGICYNVPASSEDQIWPPSVECQIQEGDVGDFWLLGYSTIQVDGKQNKPLLHSQIVKKKDAEKPTGEWNSVEVISFNGKCVHVVNGVVVHYGENSSLIGGKILLQSEYAELYYRDVKLREL
jgi:hypothetical protein